MSVKLPLPRGGLAEWEVGKVIKKLICRITGHIYDEKSALILRDIRSGEPHFYYGAIFSQCKRCNAAINQVWSLERAYQELHKDFGVHLDGYITYAIMERNDFGKPFDSLTWKPAKDFFTDNRIFSKKE